MRAHSSAVSIARPAHPRQHSFRESVQMRRDVDDFKRALCAPFHEAAYGSRKDCGNLVMLAKNAERETNKVAETMVRLSFGALSLVGLDAARKPCQVLDAMLCAAVAAPVYSMDALHELETEIGGQMNDIQIAYALGDRSTRRKLQLLDAVNKALSVLEKMKAALIKEIYGSQS